MPGAPVDDTLAVTLDGEPLTAAETLIGGEGRTHLLSVGRPGRVVIDYQATVAGRAGGGAGDGGGRVVSLRPSRYAESDRLAAVAGAEFAGISGPQELLAAVSSWVGTQL